jgi:membrane protein DedA with SNARE-associated domain
MDAWLSRLVASYGYLAVFWGALVGEDSLLALAAYAAERGYLSLPAVICAAFLGAVLGGQFFFLIGRRSGRALVGRWPRLQARTERAERLLLRYPGPVIIGVRFAHGLRLAGLIAIGMSGLPARRFFIFNAIGALIWAPLVAGVGFLFWDALGPVLGDLRQYEMIGLMVLAVLMIVVPVLILASVFASHALRRGRT